jgi:ribosomal protein S18 acetylase RimI-like enzyme
VSEDELRRIGPDDWAAFKEVRLRALADAPDAFGAVLADARQQPDSLWQERAAGPGPTLVGLAGGAPVAMGGLFAPEDHDLVFVWGMWTAPEARGRGWAGRILDDLLVRARVIGRDVVLHVTEGNDAARRLYVGRGFEPTGTWEPLREGSPLRIEELRLRLT